MRKSYRNCNLCGRLLDDFDLQEKFEIHTTIGYGSVHDGETIDLKICCDCMDKIIRVSKISPIIKEEC